MQLDIYQGDGLAGPYGYIDGWFVAWKFDGDKLSWTLEQDAEYGVHCDDDPCSQEEAEAAVAAAVADLESSEYSRTLERIRDAWRESQLT